MEPRAAQIEIAILQPRLLRDVRFFRDRERRRLRLVQHAHLARAHLDFTGRHVLVDGLGRAALHATQHRDHEF
jgi:hypothetical protein